MTESASRTRSPLPFLATLAAIALAGGVFLLRDAPAEAVTITVYKTPTCGCCTKWIDHLEDAGFTIDARDLPDLTALKAENGVPAGMASCHTATVDGYVVEGHVPAEDIRRLLADRPAVAGLAVPGMPMGSPGMEHPDPRRHEAYDVLAFGAKGGDGAAEGGTRVFSSHTP